MYDSTLHAFLNSVVDGGEKITDYGSFPPGERVPLVWDAHPV